MTHEQLQLVAGAGALLGLVALGVVLSRHRRRRTEAQAYLRGVRSMLSGDPGAAIEALSGAARLGTAQARESYLALGALLRREGDLARAIRLHRNMLAGPGLEGGTRREVERELAEDYRRSGMLEEAASLLEHHPPGERASLEALREVRADQGDFRGAAALQARLGGPPRLGAHLLAAAARADLAPYPPGGEVPAAAAASARSVASAAVAADPGCGAAWLALAEAEGAVGGDGRAGLEALARALQAEPACLVLGWPAVARQPDGEGALAALATRRREAPQVAALALLEARLLHALGRTAQALAVLREGLAVDTSGEVALAIRERLREAGPTAGPPEDLAARHALAVLALQAPGRVVRCAQCGGEAPALAWRCSRCGAFDSLA